MINTQRGFTVIELLVAIVVVVLLATVFMIQKNDLETSARDNQRKTAINTIHYTLQKVYFPQYGYYPQKMDEKSLPMLDPAFLKDPSNKKVGEAGSSYRYEPTDCSGGKCKAYTVRADLEKEKDFVKSSN